MQDTLHGSDLLGEANMSDGRPQISFIDHDRYSEATNNLRLLKSRLDDGAVQSLAKEVLTRMSARSPANNHMPSPHDIDLLAQALIGRDDTAGPRMIADLRTAGTTLDHVYIDYLSAAAERLGNWWAEDHVSITDVTLGASRIFGIMHALGEPRRSRSTLDQPTALFASVPGDTHVLGLKMAADLFRQQGWDIQLFYDLGHDQLVEKIDTSNQTIIGLSGSGRKSIEALARLIVAIRIHRPEAFVLVSGHVVEEEPELLAAAAPDAVAADIPAALDVMSELLQRKSF